MRINQGLQRLGLSPNEVKVYLSALESGPASAQDIAKRAKLKRTTTYSVLGYLVQKGMIGITKQKNRSRFIAEPPERLLEITAVTHAAIKGILPELAAIQNRHETKPKITFYEGAEAIQRVYDDTLFERPGEILEWNTNAYFNQFPRNHNYIGKRTALNIHAKRIAPSGSLWQTKHKPKDAQELSQTVIVPTEKFSPAIEVNIYNNKVAFMNYAENMSVIIESKPIADAMRQAYELSWKGAISMEIK